MNYARIFAMSQHLMVAALVVHVFKDWGLLGGPVVIAMAWLWAGLIEYTINRDQLRTSR